MDNVFKCQNCGAENSVGQVFCSGCKVKIQYACPRCRSGVAGDEASCRRCGQQLNWPSRQPASAAARGGQDDGGRARSAGSWLFPLLGLIIVLAAIGAGVYWLKKMADEPPHPVIPDSPDTTEQNAVFTPDLTAPAISEVVLINVNFNTVDVTWVTDEPASSQLIWRLKEGSPQTSELKQALVTRHLIELTDLKNKSTYYYRVRSVDQAGNEALSAEKAFDIGIQKGVPRVEVAWSAIKTVEQQPGVFKTIINGEVKNSGESALDISRVAVIITVTVTGKPGTSTVQASLDPYPLVIYPQEVHKFTAEVPSRTEPVYKVEAGVTGE